jgi:hypothetical protein
MRSLILYWHPLGSPARLTVRGHLTGLARAVGGESSVMVNAVGGAHPVLARLNVDCVLLHTTFLGIRWITPFERWRARSAWIGKLGVPVLAFPQDDYDHSDVLDEWLGELGATDVFTSLAQDVGVLYLSRAGGARFHEVLTGYLDEETAAVGRSSISLARREVDVVYRAASLPYWYGSHGQLKRKVGVAASAEAERRGLRPDISTSPDDVIAGRRWLEFLARGRVAVGCESGASAIDRRGELRRAILAQQARQPGASFENVSAHLPAGWDDRRFFVVSPRHLEAAATRTAQVLVEGRYSGVLEAGRHYLPVRSDLSDLGDALELARDPDVLQETADRTYEEVVASGTVSHSRFVALIRDVLRSRGCDPDVPPERTAAWRVLRRGASFAGTIAGWSRPGSLLRRD